MKSIAISGSPRENVGKRDAKELRYKGHVPCVLYGGKEQTHFSVLAEDLRGLVYTPDAMFVDLDIAGKKAKATMQDIQFHPVTDLIIHVDFLETFEDKPTVMNIPVKVVGTSPGVKMGGRLVQKLKKLRVVALPKNHVDFIEVNIDSLEMGKLIRVSDLPAGKLEILNSKVDTILSVVSTRASRQADDTPGK